MTTPAPPEPTEGRWNLAGFEAAVAARLEAWGPRDVVGRIWRKDTTFWPRTRAADIARRLGWLLAPERSAAQVGELEAFAEAVRRDGFDHVLLLGMGGSSLAAEVICGTLPSRPGSPRFSVLESTHPLAVRACLAHAPVDRTLYLVSSKSGTTLEPNAFLRFFWERTAKLPGDHGRRFVAITDPGTPLQALAASRHFRACFAGPEDVGGRYSALTVFGLVPAVLAGVDITGLLSSARAMAARCAERADLAGNPGLHLGAALGELALAGRDKLVFLPSRSLRPFPGWAEQLVAESLGKAGRGVVPVAAPPPPSEFPRGTDVVYVALTLDGESDRQVDEALDARAMAGAPVLRFRLSSLLDLGREFFRWEFAIATCGAVTEVDPFDQPDVERAKELARREMDPHAGGPAPYGLSVASDEIAGAALVQWLRSIRPGDYIAVQAFLAPDGATDAGLDAVVSKLRRQLGTVVTLGYGPKFLHSTGQLHKGGPATGAFLQVVDETTDPLSVPELGLSFAEILRGQARGDRAALEESRRRLVVVDVGAKPVEGLVHLAKLLDHAAVGMRAGERPS